MAEVKTSDNSSGAKIKDTSDKTVRVQQITTTQRFTARQAGSSQAETLNINGVLCGFQPACLGWSLYVWLPWIAE
jgi:hypothetical protein